MSARGKPREGRDRSFATADGQGRLRPGPLWHGSPGRPEPVSDTPCGPAWPARPARAGAASGAGRRQSCTAGNEPIRPSLAPDPPVRLPPLHAPHCQPGQSGWTGPASARARTCGGGPQAAPSVFRARVGSAQRKESRPPSAREHEQRHWRQQTRAAAVGRRTGQKGRHGRWQRPHCG